ncbi:uncharacterized protein FOMMEDRAFT_149881 [Fomitiporia mediterranea MF3/22]|uniref:uncharacterized protein n=1 Tax=Fomitiporia mediterranea (strain MF3/22) TaxID=694068 RepID=UPI0004408683|nr:uncharacterized protein FOMMEDRAFT_149881 [Fomitiporia mediterranea MF3/22]EJD07361.1 hypothetical protein FOMMEDRAFT_149881 [Fomitiporia mediterranea MF3/22]
MDSANARGSQAGRPSKSNDRDKGASSQTARTSDITDAQETTNRANDQVTALDIACSFFNRREAADRSKVDLIHDAKQALTKVKEQRKKVDKEPEKIQGETVKLQEARRRSIVQGRLTAAQGDLENRKTELLGALKPLCDEWETYITEKQRQLTLPGLEAINNPLRELYQALEHILSRESEKQYDQAMSIWNNAYVAADKLKTLLLPEQVHTRFRGRNEEETCTNASTKASASGSNRREYDKARRELKKMYDKVKSLEAEAMKGK